MLPLSTEKVKGYFPMEIGFDGSAIMRIPAGHVNIVLRWVSTVGQNFPQGNSVRIKSRSG